MATKQSQFTPAPGIEAPKRFWVHWVMLFYLVTGLSGSAYWAILQLRDMGYLTFEPYEYYFLQIVLLGGQALLMTCGWILGGILIFKYYRNWRVVIPAAFLTLSSLLFPAVILFSFLGVDPTITETAIFIVLFLYYISALFIGIEWFVRGKTRADPN